ncbi:uncharacterized protein LOC135366921 isoform X2 [Ornithodoros turicata]|uniref:uncharacterized protein LOC135366921 isoform X2 n=1 Tax=Ornithodoros turicata TaxID=34597 RepID=UPI003139B90A
MASPLMILGFVLLGVNLTRSDATNETVYSTPSLAVSSAATESRSREQSGQNNTRFSQSAVQATTKVPTSNIPEDVSTSMPIEIARVSPMSTDHKKPTAPTETTTGPTTAPTISPFFAPALGNLIDRRNPKPSLQDDKLPTTDITPKKHWSITRTTEAIDSTPPDADTSAVTNRVNVTTIQNSFWDIFATRHETSNVQEGPFEVSTSLPQRRMIPDSLQEHTVSGTEEDSQSTAASTGDQPVTATAQTVAPIYDMKTERYCTGARYCYKELNERCITRHLKTVCGCGRAFFRNPLTLVCERKMSLVSVLELPQQSYAMSMADKKSAEYKAFESAARHLVWDLVRRSKLLQKPVIDVMVTGFRPGLLVRNKLVVMSSLLRHLEPNITETMQREFDRQIKSYPVTKGSTLNMSNMTLRANGLAVNPCEDADVNFCSPHSRCDYHKHLHSMSCSCLPGYEDNSPDIENYAGEICLSICEPDHCHNNGSCRNYGFGIKCECPAWYTGNKCQYHTRKIIIIVAVVCIVLLSACAFALHKFWRQGMLIMEPSRQLTGNKMVELRLDQGPPPQTNRLAKSLRS